MRLGGDGGQEPHPILPESPRKTFEPREEQRARGALCDLAGPQSDPADAAGEGDAVFAFKADRLQ